MTHRRFSVSSFLLWLLVMLPMLPPVFAGSVDNRNNNSADYIRSLARNAATDAADVSIYNPAGTIRLQNGYHISLHNQTVAKFNEHRMANPDVSYTSKILAPLYPTAFMVYKRGSWAGFAAFSFPGGGGALHYKEGAISVFPLQTNLNAMNPFRDADVRLQRIYYGLTLGQAWQAQKWVSFSLAARALYARTDIRVDADPRLPDGSSSRLIDHMEEARGATAIFGVDFFPVTDLVLAVRLEGPTPLNWEVQYSDLNFKPIILDPATRAGYELALREQLRAPKVKFVRDLPANIGLGAGYAFLPGLRADVSFNYYLNTEANWGGEEDDHSDGWEISASGEFKWNKYLRTSLGAMYTSSGADSKSYSIENPSLNSISAAVGGRIDFTPYLGLTLGWTGNYSIQDEGTVSLGSIQTTADLLREVHSYAVGLEYRFGPQTLP